MCVCVCVSMIIHSSVDGLLSCFHILTIVCNAAMSIYLFKLLGFFFLDICSGVELLGHVEVLFLVIWKFYF